jgi:AraC-like DNA-binding protein
MPVASSLVQPYANAGSDVFMVFESGEGSVVTTHPTGCAFWCFSLSFDQLLPLFAANEMSLLDALAERLKSIKAVPALTPLASECHRLMSEVTPQQGLDQRGQLIRIAAAVLSNEFQALQRPPEGLDPTELRFVQVFEKLSLNDLLSLPVVDLAAKFGCSRRHLNRLFRQRFGFSVTTLKMEIRLLRATFLLRNPEAKIINVAAECGFNHLGLFNVCFRRRFGRSPTAWRRSDAKTRNPLERSAVLPLPVSRL